MHHEEPTGGQTEDPSASAGLLIGVGVGPGDPDLLTLAAVKALGAADVVAFHEARTGSSNARAIAAAHLRAEHILIPLRYPVTTQGTDHPGGYEGALEEFYGQACEQIAEHLDVGRTVAVLAEGDPFLYSSFQHLHERLADRYRVRVIPGISSMTAAATTLNRPLTEGTESLTVLPGTLPVDELTARLAVADSAVVMKLGRTFATVREAIRRAGRLDEAWYVERVSGGDREKVAPLHTVDPQAVPYFSLAVLPSRIGSPAWAPRAGDPADLTDVAPDDVAPDAPDTPGAHSAPPRSTGARGRVDVVGLGPAGAMWRSPEVSAALAQATDVIGYATYVRRVPDRPGLVKHLSDNKVEAQRAEFALDLARRGHRVVVVSSGDAGIFAMATAVLEVAAEQRYQVVPVSVLPGITAAAAAAARVGAPIGHDFATISLSDRLKPFAVVRERVRAAAQADLVIVLYNPASGERTTQLGVVTEDLRAIHAPQTPVVVARAVGSPQESVHVCTLGDFDPTTVDMRTLLIIGSSQTRVSLRTAADASTSVGVPGPDGQQVVWTPRTYPSTDND